MPNFVVTEEDLRQAKETALGGRFTRREIHLEGIPTVLLHTAVSMTADEFRPDHTGSRGFHRLKTFYELLDIHAGDRFFPFAEAEAVEEYGVFSFYATKEWLCLRQLEQTLPAEAALDIFRRLISLLEEYSRCPINRNGYRPLLFICLDSVYIRCDEKGTILDICLLPMPGDPHTTYIGMPRDIHQNKADMSADVYMAAYLYLQLRYPDGRPFAEGGLAEYDRLAERCISLFPQRRPSPEELFRVLEMSPAAPPVPQPPREKSPGTDRVHILPVAEDSFPPQAAPRHKPSALEKFLRGKKKHVDKVTDTLTGARDKFDGILSTDQGDLDEEDGQD